MKKIVIIVVVIVLVVIGIFAFKGPKTDVTNGVPGNVDREKVDVVDAPSTMTASFECTDATKFTVEFPTEDEASIKVDGKVVRTLSYVGPGLTFDGPGYTYAFSKEGATVTDKATKKKVTCTQPAGAEVVDFGDANAKQDATSIIKTSLTGKWKGLDAVTSSIEFTTSGTAVETDAAGQTTLSGKYTLFTKANAPKGFVAQANIVYIQIKGTGTNTQTVYYKVGEIEADMLILLTDKDEVRAYSKI